MTIKMHFHVADVSFGTLRPGDPCCHVYSDVSAGELLAWADANRVPRSWFQAGARLQLPHFDLWGARLRQLSDTGERVSDAEFVADIRALRGRKAR